ncbi:MAG: tetratricopeptide repeat protein [Pseudomonadota bacterium]
MRSALQVADEGDAATEAETTQISARTFPAKALERLLIAEFAIRRGEPGVAVKNYLEVAKETRDPEVAERATRMAVYARDQAAGLEAASLWKEVAPDELDAQQAYVSLLLRTKDDEKAADALVAFGERWNEPMGYGYQIVAQLLNRERDKAHRLRLMRKIAAKASENPYALASLSRVAARSGETSQALALVESALELKPDIEEHVMLLASVQRMEGRVETALETLETYLTGYNEASDARMLFGRYLIDAKRYDDARAQFETLAAQHPERDDVRYALGLLLMQTERHAEAAPHFRKLVELGKRRETAFYYLGQIDEALEKPDDAIKSYRRVDRGEHYINAQVRIASIYASKGQVDRAREHLSSVRRDSVQDDIRLYRAEAELYARDSRFDEALQVYDTALKQHPENSDLLYARAMVGARAERYDILERDLRDILSREPNNADALNALGYTLADQTDRYDEAYDLVKRAYELKPNDHYIIDSMGWVLYRLGRYEEAVKHLERALGIQADAEIAAHLGEVLWVLGRKAEARKVWDTALRETPNDKRLLEVIDRFSE